MTEIVIYFLMFTFFISFVFGIFEIVFTDRFSKQFFKVGKLIYKNELAVLFNKELIEIQKTYKFNYGKFNFISEDECLYYTTYSFLQFDFAPIKGKITLNNSLVIIDTRLYLSISLFLITWLAFWTFGGLKLIFINYLAGLSFILIGWVFIGGIFYFQIKHGRKYAIRFLDEIISRFGADCDLPNS